MGGRGELHLTWTSTLQLNDSVCLNVFTLLRVLVYTYWFWYVSKCDSIQILLRKSPQSIGITAILVEWARQLQKLDCFEKVSGLEGITYSRVFTWCTFCIHHIWKRNTFSKMFNLSVVCNINWCFLMVLMHLFCLNTASTAHFICS